MLSKILQYLDQNRVTYNHRTHRQAYTAKEVAVADHVPANEVAKTVVFRKDGDYEMAVLPADCVVNVHELRVLINSPHLRLATEGELTEAFPECEVGAMPALGNLFHMPVYVDSRLAQEKMIEFNAGTHRDVVRLQFEDYARLVKPTIIDFARIPAIDH